jgi:hypothetical protein
MTIVRCPCCCSTAVMKSRLRPKQNWFCWLCLVCDWEFGFWKEK